MHYQERLLVVVKLLNNKYYNKYVKHLDTETLIFIT